MFANRLLGMRMKFQISSLLALTVYVAVMLAWNQIGTTFLLLATPVSLVVVVIGFAGWPMKIPNFLRRIATLNLLIALILFVAIGPATRIAATAGLTRTYEKMFRPVSDSLAIMPDGIQHAMRQYVNAWMPKGMGVVSSWPKHLGWSKKQWHTTKRGKNVTVETVMAIPRESDLREWRLLEAKAQSASTSPAVTNVEVSLDSAPGN